LHQFSLSPFVGLTTHGSGSNNHHGTQTLASFKTMDAHKSKLLKQSMYYHHRRNEKKPTNYIHNNNNNNNMQEGEEVNSRDLSQDQQPLPP